MKKFFREMWLFRLTLRKYFKLVKYDAFCVEDEPFEIKHFLNV